MRMQQDSAALRRNLFRRSMVAGQPPQSSGRRRDTDEAQARFGLWALGRVLYRGFGCCSGGVHSTFGAVPSIVMLKRERSTTLEATRPNQGKDHHDHVKSRHVMWVHSLDDIAAMR